MKYAFLFLLAVSAASCSRINAPAASADGETPTCGEGEVLDDGACVCVAGSACDERAPAPDDDDDDREPVGCLDDADCVPGGVCDDDGVCRDVVSPPGGCVRDSECPTGHTCTDDGDCVDTSTEPACARDDDCASDEACTDDGACVRVEPEPQGCVRDSECPSGHVCTDDGDCVDADDPDPTPACTDDGDCAGTDVCTDDGDCVPTEPPPPGDDTLCVLFDQAVDVDDAGFFTDGDQELPADRNGVTSVCVTLDIAADGLAHFNLRLDQATYLAHNENDERCALAGDFLRATLNGSTVDVVALPTHCEDDPRGCSGSELVPVAGCDAWIGVEQVVECADDGDCAGTDVCDDDGACVPVAPAPECDADADCVGDDVCDDDGNCVDPPAPVPECADDGDCAGTDVCNDDGACVATSAVPACTFDAECGADERCNDAGDCVDAAPPEPCVLDNECGLDEVCNDAGTCVEVTGNGPPPTGQAAAIIENASGKETVLEIRADQFPLCNAATNCSNGDPEIFRKSQAHVIDLGGCLNNILFDPAAEEETGVVDPVNDLVNVVDGVYRIDFSLARFSCPGTQFIRLTLVSTVQKDGSGTPNPDFDYRNVEWRTMTFGGVGSAFKETDPLTGFPIVEVELVYDADGELIRIEPGA